ncbi:MAG: hypothetical protein ABI759_13320 [Candidatus Solibacter sp.]
MRPAMLYTLAVMLAATTAAMGQTPGGMGRRGMGAVPGGPTVDIKGKVASVQITPGAGMPFVTIKNGDQKMKVYLGSMRYLMGQGFNPKMDEEIVVKAYKWNDDFVAATVTLPAQGKTLRLRDDDGRPLWRGGPMR